MYTDRPQDRAVPRPQKSNPRRRLPHWYTRGYLPHFATNFTSQMVTYRLADSLPRHVAERLLSDLKRTRNDKNYRKKIEAFLDAGYGECWLKRPEIAALVEQSFQHFHQQRYNLHAYVLMPNHVHLLLDPIAPCELSEIVQGWKSWTARKMNAVLHRKGTVWQAEYWDRFVRDESHYFNALNYIVENPVKAGLAKDPNDWPWTWVRAV